ncbi:MAG: glycosyltransferase [Ferrimicrobium sp.]
MLTSRLEQIHTILQQRQATDALPLIKAELAEFPLRAQGWVFLANALELMGRDYEAWCVYRRGWLLNPTARWADAVVERLAKTEPSALAPWLAEALAVPEASISVAVIARSEERCIARCIDSVKGVVDDVVVVDTGSTDNTRQIAAEHGARVFDFEWNDDFAAARNFALAQVKTDWVLWVDADEWLDPDHADSPRVVAGLFSQLDYPIVIHVVQVNPLPHRVEYAYDAPRMHSTKYDITWKRRIHEQLVPGPDGAPWPSLPASVNIRLFHDGYDKEVIDRSAKLTRNIKLLRQVVAEDPDDVSAWGFLGRDLFHHDEYEEAIKAFEELEARVGESSWYREQRLPEMRTFFIAALIATEQFERAHQIALQGTIETPNYPLHWFDLGKLELRLLEMRLANARQAFCNADVTAKTWQGGTSLDPSIGQWRAKAGMGDVAKLSGNLVEATRIYQQAYREAPEAEALKKMLANIAEQVGVLHARSMSTMSVPWVGA